MLKTLQDILDNGATTYQHDGVHVCNMVNGRNGVSTFNETYSMSMMRGDARILFIANNGVYEDHTIVLIVELDEVCDGCPYDDRGTLQLGTVFTERVKDYRVKCYSDTIQVAIYNSSNEYIDHMTVDKHLP